MSEIDRLIRSLEDLPEQLETAAQEQAKEELETVVDRAQRNLKRHGTWWHGDIGRSMEVIETDERVYLATLAGHAAYVEYGTGAYFGTGGYPISSDVHPYDAPSAVSEAMIDNLIEWVQTKPITSTHYETDRALAEAIAHTIVELGTRAQPYLRPAWYSHRERALSNIEDAVERRMKQEF